MGPELSFEVEEGIYYRREKINFIDFRVKIGNHYDF